MNIRSAKATITKEMQANTDVFAVSKGPRDTCAGCFFHNRNQRCISAACTPLERADRRNVFFRPTTDLRVQALYHSQASQGCKNVLKVSEKTLHNS